MTTRSTTAILTILSRHHLAPTDYQVHVLGGRGKTWVRLSERRNSRLVGIWSRARADTGPGDLDRLRHHLTSWLSHGGPARRPGERAPTIFVDGWETWPGIPAPIAAELRAPAFEEELRRFPTAG